MDDRELTARPLEYVVVAALFGFVCVELFRPAVMAVPPATGGTTGLVLFAVLSGGYLGLSLGPVRAALQRFVSVWSLGQATLPFALLAVVAFSTVGSDASGPGLILVYAFYFLLPVLLLGGACARLDYQPLRQLAAALALWLPVELGLPRPPIDGPVNPTHLLALVMGLYGFLVLNPLDGVGYTFLLSRRDWRWAGTSLVVFLCIAVPVGLAIGFVEWRPRLTLDGILHLPWHIYLWIGVPEEFLFRGLIQNLAVRRLGLPRGLALASVVFGLAHLPDPSYVLLATIAGVAYGWVYARTGRITASALTHAAVDWIWVLAFPR